MAEALERAAGRRRKGGARGRPRKKQAGLDSTGVAFQGPTSWQSIRFHKNARRRDHRKLSLLVETGPAREKFVYHWQLDTSRVGDVSAARVVLPQVPPDTSVVTMDGAYDSRDLYTLVEEAGAEPIIKPRAGYSLKSQGHPARPRALRWREGHPAQWQAKYNRRPITESVNSSLKRRFGTRLWSRGLRAQRREMALRILAYNVCLKARWATRVRIHRGEL